MHIKREFVRNKDVSDEAAITALRSNAMRGLSNYLMIETSQKDAKFQATQKSFVKSEVESMKNMEAISVDKK